MGLKKQCRCGAKIDIKDTCCPSCNKVYKQRVHDKNKLYDSKRDEKAHSFYTSTRWHKFRDAIVNRFKGIDIYLYYTQGVIAQGNTVHHIIEVNEDDTRKLDVSNVILVSKYTHEKIHRLYKDNKEATQQLLFDLIERWEADTILGN